MNEKYNKHDWKLFMQKLPQWQEQHMEKLCSEYVKILSKDTLPSERFWELEKRIREDKRHTGVSARISRSNMDINILSLIREDVITLNDLDEFSNELKDSMQLILDRTSPC